MSPFNTIAKIQSYDKQFVCPFEQTDGQTHRLTNEELRLLLTGFLLYPTATISEQRSCRFIIIVQFDFDRFNRTL